MNERFYAVLIGGYIQLYEPYQKLFLSTDPLQAEYEEASRMIYSI